MSAAGADTRRARGAAAGRAPARPALAGDQDRAVSTARISALMELLGSPQRSYPTHPRRGHQRQDVGGPDDRRAADRAAPPHRPHHQPAPAVGGRADLASTGSPISPRSTWTPTARSSRSSSWSTRSPRPAGGPADEQVRGRSPPWRSPRSPTPPSTSRWSRSGWAAAGTPPTSSTRRWPSSPRSASTTPSTSATPSPTIAGEKAGIIVKQPDDLVPTDTVAVIGQQAPEAMEVLLAQAVRSRRGGGPRGLGVRGAAPRRSPSADSCSSCRASAGSTPRSSCPCTASTRRTTRCSRWPRSRRSSVRVRDRQLDIDAVRAGFASVDQPGSAGADAQRPNGVHRCRAQPGRRGGARRGAGPRSSTSAILVGVVVGDGRQGRRRHPRRARAGVRRRSWSPTTARRARWTSRGSRCAPRSGSGPNAS